MLVLSTIGLVFIVAFLAASIAVLVTWIMLGRRSGENGDPGPIDFSTPSSNSPILLQAENLSTVGLMADLLARFDFTQRMKARIAEAGLNWSVGRVTAMMLLCGALVWAALMSLDWVPALVVLGAGCLASLFPYFYILRRRAARFAQFEEQFPEALDYLSRALRAGHPFAVALEMLSGESSPPLSMEMRKTFEDRQLGSSWEQALQNLARRLPLMEVSFFAAAVQLHSRTGGKLGEVLGRLAETMRERSALRGEVRALAAHSRLTGTVLTVIPVVVMAVMVIVNPAYLGILLENPYGHHLILAALGCLTLAHFVMRWIVNIKP